MVAHDPVVNPSIHYLGVVGSAGQQDHGQCAAQWERIKAERSSEYGPLGAYNFGGCVHGQRFEGRGWYQDSEANGGENGIWYNAGSRALCILVGTDDPIPPVCVDMIRAFANEAINIHGMQWPLRGHSEFVATSCPGNNLRAVISDINANHAPVPPSLKKNGATGMLVGLKKKPGTPNHDAFLVDGGVIVRQFLGDIVNWGFVNTQKDGKAFAEATGVPPLVLNDIEWALIEARTTATTK